MGVACCFTMGEPNFTESVTVVDAGQCVYKYNTGRLWLNSTRRAVYGGQIATQALNAAVQTLSEDTFSVHSIHCYYVSPVKQLSDLFYHVERVKDGTSFCSRYVKAIQGDRTVFQCMVSFYKPGEANTGLDHKTSAMPDVPRPDSKVPSSSEYEIYKDKLPMFTRGLTYHFYMYVCIEKQRLQKVLNREEIEPRSMMWVKLRNTISCDQNFQRGALLYVSDSVGLCYRWKYPRLELSAAASLDHAIWFHAHVDTDQWYLMVSECEHAVSGKPIIVCRFYSTDGTLVATCRQEYFIRPKL